MKTALQEQVVMVESVNDIPFQAASLDIWEKKYRLVAKDGTVLDQQHGRHLHAHRAGARRRRA
jgi:ribonucleoside-diphosphate reductase alpha chain